MNLIKKTFLYFILIIFHAGTSLAQYQWSPQTSGTSSHLNCIFFTSLDSGWAVGSSGLILNTTNGGTVWSSQTSNTGNHLTRIYFIDSFNGWAVGDIGTVIKTVDGGSNWANQTTGVSFNLDNGFFLNANNGWACGSGIDSIIATNNGGTNWTSYYSGSADALRDLFFVDTDTGWAVGWNGKIIRSTDGGANWSGQTSNTTENLYSVHFLDLNKGWVVGGNGTIRYTSDAGTNWNTQTSGTTELLYRVYFLNSDTGWAVGENGTIVHTTNGGTNWSSQVSGSSDVLTGVHFIDAQNGWISGYNGTILHSSPNITVHIDSLKFCTKQLNSFDALQLLLYNTGIDTLFDTLQVAAPFSVSATYDTIVPGDSSIIDVVFNPTSEGFFTDSVNIKSNSLDSSNIDVYVSGWSQYINLTSIKLGDSTVSATNVTDTVQFTTTRDLVATDEIVLRFPSGFDVSGLSIDGASSFTPTVESASSNIAVLSLSGALSSGTDTLILAGINNPTTALREDTLIIVARQNSTEDTLIFADASPVVLNIVGTLTLSAATNPVNSNNLPEKAKIGGTAVALSNFKLTAAGEHAVVTQFQITPTFSGMLVGEISNLDIYLDSNNDGTIDVGEPSIATPVDDNGSGSVVNITVLDTVYTSAAKNYIVAADFQSAVEKLDDISIDIGAASTITDTGIVSGSATTKSGNAITGYTHTVTIPYLNLTSILFNDSSVNAVRDTVTVDFTTYAALAANDTIRFYFPYGFSFTIPTIATGSSFTPSIESSSDSTLILSTTGSVTAGNKSLILTGVNNPSTAISDGTISMLTLRQGAADTVHLADATPDAYNIAGTLTLSAADNPITLNALAGLATVGDTNIVLTTFKLTAAGENSVLSQIQLTPTFLYMAQSEINIIDIYKDLNDDGFLDPGETSITTATVDGPVSGNTITFNVNETVASGSANYLVVAAFKSSIAEGDSFRINVEACSQISASGAVTSVSPVKSGSSITGYYHKATPPVIDITSTTLTNPMFGDSGSMTIVFTTNQDIPNIGDEIVVTFPSGFDISNISLSIRTATQSLHDPVINTGESSDRVIVLDTRAYESKGQFTLVFDNIVNPSTVQNNVSVDISTRLDDNTELDADDANPAVFDVVGKLTLSSPDVVISRNNFDTLFHIGGTNIPVTSFKLKAEGEDFNVTSIQLTPRFGKLTTIQLEKIDIFEDANGNGIIDSGENSITTGTGDDNRHDVPVDINTTGYTLSEDSTNFIITVNLADSVGAEDWLEMNVESASEIVCSGAITGSAPVKTGDGITGNTQIVLGFELIPALDTTTVEGRELSFTYDYATTFSGSPLFLCDSLPTHAVLDSFSGIFTWTPDMTQAGTFEMYFSGSLNGVTDRDTVIIVVTDTDLLTQLVEPETVLVNSVTGGTVRARSGGVYSGHLVIIPPGALAADKNIVIRAPDTSQISLSEIDSVPSAVQFEVKGEEEGFTFEDSVTLTLEYKPFEIKRNARNMRIFNWDRARRFWKRVFAPHTLDIFSNLISVKDKHFSIYGVREVSELEESSSINGKWNIIALPFEPENSNPVSIFSPFINPFRYERNNSNIHQYNEETGEWELPVSIINGNGYTLYGWDDNTNITIEGLEVVGDITKSLSYTNDNGWHLLGNPFAENLDWDNNCTKTNLDAYYYYWNGSEYLYYPGGSRTAVISSWEGFFVKANNSDASLLMEYPGAGSSKRGINNNRLKDIEWRIQVIAQSKSEDKVTDSQNYLGVSGYASDTFDKMDVYELVPLNDTYISLYFPHENWEVNPAKYTQDIKPLSEENMQWDFEVLTNAGNSDIELTFNIPENIPVGFNPVLIDKDRNNKRIDLSAYQKYTYRTGEIKLRKTNNALNINGNNPTDFSKIAAGNNNIRHFAVVLEKVEEEKQIPDVYFINQNYPNPFNPSTTIEYGLPEEGNITIEIFNVLGQRIKTLVNDIKIAGYYKVTWNGDDNYGIKVASGVYIYRMKSKLLIASKKLILLK